MVLCQKNLLLSVELVSSFNTEIMCVCILFNDAVSC